MTDKLDHRGFTDIMTDKLKEDGYLISDISRTANLTLSSRQISLSSQINQKTNSSLTRVYLKHHFKYWKLPIKCLRFKLPSPEFSTILKRQISIVGFPQQKIKLQNNNESLISKEEMKLLHLFLTKSNPTASRINPFSIRF